MWVGPKPNKQPVGYNESLVHHTGEYLVRYANRVAMSNSRLVSIEGQEVVFRYRDHHDGGTWRTTSLPGVEFLGTFSVASGPPGPAAHPPLRLVGQCGADREADAAAPAPGRPASRVGGRGAADAAEETEEPPDPELRRLEEEQGTPRKCRTCGGKMELIYQTPRPTVPELLRMPPSMELLVETGPLQLHLPISAFVTTRHVERKPTACRP